MKSYGKYPKEQKHFSREELIEFFDKNIKKIFEEETNQHLDFILEIKNEAILRSAFKEWPQEIKLEIVKKYLFKLPLDL